MKYKLCSKTHFIYKEMGEKIPRKLLNYCKLKAVKQDDDFKNFWIWIEKKENGWILSKCYFQNWGFSWNIFLNLELKNITKPWILTF